MDKKRNFAFHQHGVADTCSLDSIETKTVQSIMEQRRQANADNISRTLFYQNFYLAHPDIEWSFLASMVSRNAGWNMCDLSSLAFVELLGEHVRKELFLTYERANWLIFQDACPQLLLYHYSTLTGRSLFHLLDIFSVSAFMKREWELFWAGQDRGRLLRALIINEQNLIQQPVLNHPLYKRSVFRTIMFRMQELFHYSCVLFPTRNGSLYGTSITDFRDTEARIELGKRLSSILFHPDLHPLFEDFARKTEPTGSRYDYERYLPIKKRRTTPFLRTVFPLIEHHEGTRSDWTILQSPKEKWFEPVPAPDNCTLTDWYFGKQSQIERIARLKKKWT